MVDTETFIIILSALCLIIVILLVIMRKKSVAAKEELKRKSVTMNVLQTAQSQNEIFEMHMLDNTAAKTTMAAILESINVDKLGYEILGHVPRGWTGSIAEIYFRVVLSNGPAFYKFNAQIQSVHGGRDKSHIRVNTPMDLEVGQKRGFIRLKPNKDAVKVIGLWKLDPAKPLPKNKSEISSPLTHYKVGMKEEPIQIENISGSGLAIRFPLIDPQNPPVELELGDLLLCLIIYAFEDHDSEKLVTFWCTSEIVNSRILDSKPSALLFGLEFTNWAVMEQGESDINWFHSSPSRGASPITQWVLRMDMGKRKV